MIEEQIDFKKWYCIDPNCSWYKTKMTIETHLDHMIKIHGMVAPKGYEITQKPKSVSKNTKSKKKRKHK